MYPNQPDDLFFDGDMHDSQFAYLFQRDDIPFWIAQSHDYGPRVLELACGTGRITIYQGIYRSSIYYYRFAINGIAKVDREHFFCYPMCN